MTKHRAEKLFSFSDWARDHPSDAIPGDRLDIQLDNLRLAIVELGASLGRLVRADGKLNAEVLPFPAREASSLAGPKAQSAQSAPLEGPAALGPNAGGFYASDKDGATATSADYAQVSIEWAEHMPDTIPGNVLAINAITGDHWSSRWWANKAAMVVSVLGRGDAGLFAEQLAVTAPNALSPLSATPADGGASMELIVNGRVFSSCATPPPFTVDGRSVVWASTIYGLAVGGEVIARYRVEGGVVAVPMTGKAISLYYLAVAGQANFPLSTPDRFSLSYTLLSSSTVQVSRNGSRLMPDDGSGKGGFIVAGNTITLLWPAGLDETIIVDVWEQA